MAKLEAAASFNCHITIVSLSQKTEIGQTSVHKLSNTNVVSMTQLTTPEELRVQFPRTAAATATVEAGRQEIENILDGTDQRLLVVVGPCSIHDVDLTKDYAKRLLPLRKALSATMNIVMRVYFEKPRTTVGWKGFINDPDLNDSFHIEEGLAKSRELLLWLAEAGMPTGTEALDPISPQYLSDLFSWSAIGARTTESQTHREMASGLSTAVGFKNGTNGSLDVAINALRSAASPPRFLGINFDGHTSVIETRGNAYGHVIMRGGSNGPNYDAENIAFAETQLAAAGLPLRIMVDCAHANSNKNHEVQPKVAANVAEQIAAGNRSIVGIMIESNIEAGNQKLVSKDKLAYGVSITDACVDWENTEKTLHSINNKITDVIASRSTESQPATPA